MQHNEYNAMKRRVGGGCADIERNHVIRRWSSNRHRRVLAAALSLVKIRALAHWVWRSFHAGKGEPTDDEVLIPSRLLSPSSGADSVPWWSPQLLPPRLLFIQ